MAEEIYTHVCIKNGCNKQYQDKDPDPYYCSECKDEVKRKAEEVDKLISSRPPKRQRKSGLEQYDAIIKGKGVQFPSINDLGNINI